MEQDTIQAVLDANATRYLNGIGLVIVLYDHVITFDDEVQHVWKAKSSFAKWSFLFNRYLVPTILIVVASFMNNFDENSDINTNTCRNFFTFSSLFGVISIGVADILVLLRVVNLWERERRIAILMAIGFLVSFIATFVLMILTVANMRPGLIYLPVVHMCVSTKPVAEIKAVWASPILFEVLVLIAVCWNAFDRPRGQNSKVTGVLLRDGMGFFGALTVLRTFNLLLATVARPSLVLLGVFFVWAMTTVVLNRALLNILRSSNNRTSSILGLPLHVTDSRASTPALRLYTSMDKSCSRDIYELR